MRFREINGQYETWLRAQCAVVDADLRRKRRLMRKNPFTFLRATFFRWAGTIESVCPEAADAPAVISVGDLHVENFGTWRDAEGRLVWGVSDFDDAALMAYPFDLIRLATSVRLAPGKSIGKRAACDAILRGYDRGLAAPRPTLIDEHAEWLRTLLACSQDDRATFWAKMAKLPAARPPRLAREALEASLPANAKILKFASRTAGCGSLGRPRYVAIAMWRGGRIVREAKAVVPSAWGWAHERTAPRSLLLDLATGSSRSPDPTLALRNGFVIRRLAADARKIEFGEDAGAGLERRLLEAMGHDLGALHARDARRASRIRRHLARQRSDWLRAAVKAAEAAVLRDFEAWRP